MGFVDDIAKDNPALLNDTENIAARKEQTELDAQLPQKFIVCNGKQITIEWPKVVLWTDEGGMGYDKSCYKPQTSRNPQMFVAHWDACLSTKSMVVVTKQRGLSVHFGIDNDGTIYQLLDTKDIAWHAYGVNNVSVGVEISNAFDPKFNPTYSKMGFPLRTLVNASIHGKEIGPYLDFYPAQIEAYKALARALHKAHNIPFQVPLDKDGNLIHGVSDEVVKCTFKGMVGHYHVTTNKIDPGNLPIDRIASDLSKETVS